MAEPVAETGGPERQNFATRLELMMQKIESKLGWSNELLPNKGRSDCFSDQKVYQEVRGDMSEPVAETGSPKSEKFLKQLESTLEKLDSKMEQMGRYNELLARDGRFDIVWDADDEEDSDNSIFGFIYPCSYERVPEMAKFVIERHNKEMQGKDDEKLEFEEFIKSNWDCTFTYYITLRAKNSRGESKVYQTEVNSLSSEEEPDISFLRESADPSRCWTYDNSFSEDDMGFD